MKSFNLPLFNYRYFSVLFASGRCINAGDVPWRIRPRGQKILFQVLNCIDSFWVALSWSKNCSLSAKYNVLLNCKVKFEMLISIEARSGLEKYSPSTYNYYIFYVTLPDLNSLSRIHILLLREAAGLPKRQWLTTYWIIINLYLILIKR